MGERYRSWIQFAALLIQNGNFRGFFTGKISQGAAKQVCVPGLNCYSCPGALAACPIGSLQTFLASRPVKLPYYVLGLLLFFGALLGRAVCGFLCPFGFIQELIHRIPLPRKKPGPFRGDRLLRKLKYLVLAGVIAAPLFLDWTPAFCKYLCPAGTLEGGVPLVLLDLGGLHIRVGALFFWKLAVLAAVLAACLWIFRPFCRYLCPLGAFYGLMNPVSLCRMEVDAGKCVSCGKCAGVCPMQADPAKTPNSPECIRCSRCVRECPAGALHLGFSASGKRKTAGPEDKA